MAGHRRRHRSVHRHRSLWPLATCIVALSGVVTVGIVHRPMPVSPSSRDDRTCATVGVIIDTALGTMGNGRSPSPEYVQAVEQVNERLAALREGIRTGALMKEIGCG